MLRYLKSITAVLLFAITAIIRTSYAEEIELNNQLTVPEFRVTIKSTPKLVYTPITPAFISETVPIDDMASTTYPNEYALLMPDSAKKARIEALYETHGFNKEVEKRLNFYTKKFKEEFRNYLGRAGKYLQTMAEIFIEKNLPHELVFLPLIESGFKLNAYSPKMAGGPWQFIPSTAKKFGLKIDWWVDERRDPIKSTIAAAEYLSNLYEMFGSWNLALAAYNAGEGKILQALKRARSNDFWELRKTRYIKMETKNYIPSYIAATAIALDPERFGFEEVAYHSPLEYDEVVIYSPMDLAVIAELTGSDVAEIKELNPELKRWCTPPNVSSYTLRIPAGTKEVFLSNLSNAKEEDLLFVEFYTVKKGDTVGEIARRFGVPAQVIIDLNSLGKRALIIAGSKILVPSKRTAYIREESKSSNRIKPILKNNPNKKADRKTSI
jgi:membrane-bound lytic murein transglycosylase D